jgi:transposase
MNPRQQKGLEIARGYRIQKSKKGFMVPSQSGQGAYLVTLNGATSTCTCPDFEIRQQQCKHIYAVEYTLTREHQPDGATVVTQTTRVTYRQDWPVYNAAQTHERGHFLELLRGLCDGIVQPPQPLGRPRNLLADVVFSLVCKVYAMRSGHRSMSDLRGEDLKRFLGKVPHYNSVFRCLKDPTLTPLLKTLIEESAMPLKAVETDFAVDSSGFATSAFAHWYDTRYERRRRERRWVKVHLMCGVHTHAVTSVEVTPTDSADAPQFAGLVTTTARRFSVHEVSADKAYLSVDNLQVVAGVGGIAYIPFKQRTTGLRPEFDALWNRMWHYYMFNRDTFLQHYHKRSNAETTFSMIKGKFGEVVRAKLPVAQVNEVLCKVLCHNLCVLIQSIYELKLEPTFWTGGSELCPYSQDAARDASHGSGDYAARVDAGGSR